MEKTKKSFYRAGNKTKKTIDKSLETIVSMILDVAKLAGAVALVTQDYEMTVSGQIVAIGFALGVVLGVSVVAKYAKLVYEQQ